MLCDPPQIRTPCYYSTIPKPQSPELSPLLCAGLVRVVFDMHQGCIGVVRTFSLGQPKVPPIFTCQTCPPLGIPRRRLGGIQVSMIMTTG